MQADDIDVVELEERVAATERLLSTLIAILSAREPNLLTELQAIFSSPDFAGDFAGRSAASTWSRISRELTGTAGLLKTLGDGHQN